MAAAAAVAWVGLETASKRVQSSLASHTIPVTAWKHVLLAITGALLDSFVSNDMSLLLEQLRGGILQAFAQAELFFARWLRHLEAELTSGAQLSKNSLDDLVSSLGHTDQQVQHVSAQCQMSDALCKQDLAPRFRSLHSRLGILHRKASTLRTDASSFIVSCRAAFTRVAKSWQSIHKFIESLDAIVLQVLKRDQGHDGAALFGTSADNGSSEKIAKGLRRLFRAVFFKFSQVIEDSRRVAAQIEDLAHETGRLSRSTNSTAADVGRLEQEMSDRFPLLSADLEAGNLKAASGNVLTAWAIPDTEDEASPVPAGSLPRLLQSFASGVLGGHAAPRIGLIFLERLGRMRHGKAFRAQCSQCGVVPGTSLSFSFFAVTIATAALLLSSLGFVCCGCFRK